MFNKPTSECPEGFDLLISTPPPPFKEEIHVCFLATKSSWKLTAIVVFDCLPSTRDFRPIHLILITYITFPLFITYSIINYLIVVLNLKLTFLREKTEVHEYFAK